MRLSCSLQVCHGKSGTCCVSSSLFCLEGTRVRLGDSLAVQPRGRKAKGVTLSLRKAGA